MGARPGTTTADVRRPEAPRPAPRAGLAVFAGFVALTAWFGVVGLATGLVSIGTELEARLPHRSPVLGGLALAAVVAVPTSVLGWAAWEADPRTDLLALGSGLLLVGWIVAEYLVIRQLSFFHPTYLLVGLVLAWTGRRAVPGWDP